MNGRRHWRAEPSPLCRVAIASGQPDLPVHPGTAEIENISAARERHLAGATAPRIRRAEPGLGMLRRRFRFCRLAVAVDVAAEMTR